MNDIPTVRALNTVPVTCQNSTYFFRLSIDSCVVFLNFNHISDHSFKCLLGSVISNKTECVANFRFASVFQLRDLILRGPILS